MTRAYPLFFLSALLCGCSTVEALRPDMEAKPLPSRLDEIAYINGLREAYQGLAPNDCYAGQKLPSFRPKFSQGYNDYDPGQDHGPIGCVEFGGKKAAHQSQDGAMKRYLEMGFGLTDIYCQRYFTIATQTRQSRKLQAATLSPVDTLVNAVMNAVGAGTTALTLSNTAFEAAKTTYNNIDLSFMVAPDRDDVRDLVQAAQQDYRASAFDKAPKSYPSARAVIERYAGICSFDGMRQLVAVAVKAQAAGLNDKAQDTQNNASPQTTVVEKVVRTEPVMPAPPVRVEGVAPPITPK